MSTPETTAMTAPQPKKRRRWLLPTGVGVIALLIGYAAGSGGEDDATAASDETEELQTQVDDLIAERDALQEQLDAAGDEDSDAGGGSDVEAELDARAAELDERETALDERASELDDREEAVAEQEAAAESDDGEDSEEESDASDTSSDESDDGGSYSAGQYQFSDVQVYDDGLGDFALRARVTNTGGEQSGVIWTATLFSGGSVVGTLTGTAQDFAADSTVTVEFFSTDGFGDWDEVEFQVDTQF